MSEEQEEFSVNSIIGEGSEFNGEFKLSGLIRIDGKFKGLIQTDGKVEIEIDEDRASRVIAHSIS